MDLTELLDAIGDNADITAQLAEADADTLADLSNGIVDKFNELQNGDLSSETIEQMERLADARDTIRTEVARRDNEAAAAAEKVAALATRINNDGTGGEDDDGDEDEPDAPPAPPTIAEGDDDTADTEMPELVNAGAKRTVNLAAVRARNGAPRIPARNGGKVSITAAADLPGIPTGARLNQTQLVAAAMARYKGFPQKGRANTQLKAMIAQIERPIPKDLLQTEETSDEQALTIMDRACDQSRLPGGSLVAAGGWCAPSETVYDLCEPETVDGIASIPELGIRRGGLRYPTSPAFSDIYTGVGFIQTEAENIAGEEKDCYEITCPPFTEVRLDAMGVCITAGILQQRGYPEMVKRVINGAMTAHAHKVNAYVIARMAALSTAVTPTLAGFGAWADTLSALELQVVDLRYKYRLAESSTVEMVAPQWLKPILRADLAVRQGADPDSVATDGQLEAHFRARGVNAQWVKDWQDAYVAAGGAGLGGASAALVWPTTGKVLIYPAGTFVKGTSEIIQLDAIYDSTNIRTNSYTALFSEEGVLVAKRCLEGRLITLTELCPAGRTGIGVAYDCTP